MASSIPKDPHPPSGIKVVIIGAGFAGLTAAIECHRKGHTPIILESFKELKVLGDIISFSANSGKFFERWPGVKEQLDPIVFNSTGLEYRDYNGDYLFFQETDRLYGRSYNGHRGEIHEVVFNYALSLGIEIRLGQDVTEYFETETEAGVVANGEKVLGDIVLAADGVRSKGRKLVLGYEDKPKSSGYAVYRTWFTTEEIAKNPRTKFLIEDGDRHVVWLGPDIHFIVATLKQGRDISWVYTHKDEADVEEGWSIPGSVEDALKWLEGWDPIVRDIVSATPSLVDWKLVYRDPLPTWVSPKGRLALIGDAAHPFLPTSIQGASQAMEDGMTLAVTLALAGKGNVPDAVRAYEKIRYERVRKAQKTGETTRDMWHKADFQKIKENPERLSLPREEWLLGHDAEAHAYEVGPGVLEELKRVKT